MQLVIRRIIRTMVKHLGWTIGGILIIVAISRGTTPVSLTTAVVVSGLICVPALFIIVAITYSEKPSPLLSRIYKPDVMISLICIIVYVAVASGAMVEMQ
jgi:hypothetical protein